MGFSVELYYVTSLFQWRLPLAMPPDIWILGIQIDREGKVQFLVLNGKEGM